MAPLSKNVKTNQIHRPVQAFCDTFFGFKNTLHHFESFNSMDRFKFPSSSKAHFPLPQQTPNFLFFFAAVEAQRVPETWRRFLVTE